MIHFRSIITVIAMLIGGVSGAQAVDGLITKPSAYSVEITLDRLEAGLKEKDFTIFTRLDHAVAAQSVGLKMPRETVLVFGTPKVGTPNFLKYPTLAIDLPIKMLVWEDAAGKVWLSYNSQKYLHDAQYARHGVPLNQEAIDRVEGVMAAVTDKATK